MRISPPRTSTSSDEPFKQRSLICQQPSILICTMGWCLCRMQAEARRRDGLRRCLLVWSTYARYQLLLSSSVTDHLEERMRRQRRKLFTLWYLHTKVGGWPQGNALRWLHVCKLLS